MTDIDVARDVVLSSRQAEKNLQDARQTGSENFALRNTVKAGAWNTISDLKIASLANETTKKMKIVKSRHESLVKQQRDRTIQSLSKWDEFRQKRKLCFDNYLSVKRKYDRGTDLAKLIRVYHIYKTLLRTF